MIRRILLIGVLIVVAAAAFAASRHEQFFHLSRLALTGHSSDCPYPNAIESLDNVNRERLIKDRLLAASRLLETDPAGYEHWQTPKGSYWIPKGSQFVLPFNLAEQERQIYGSGVHFVQKGDVVLDCGANVGVFVRSALDAGAAKIIAIEPAPENLECLRRNFGQEVRAGVVVIYPKGVWDKDDILTLRVDPTNSAADSVVLHPAGAQSGVQVPLTTIDKLVSELQLSKVNFIKMDIEGAEPQALAGARETLARFKPRLAVSAYHQPDHPVRIPAAIRAARADYHQECGPCALTPEGQIRPDVLRFW